MTTVHRFDTSGDAYDASQTRDEIKDGDVLVAESERAVAVLVEAWPIAISEEYAGEAFHIGEKPFEWGRITRTSGGVKDYRASYTEACRVAESFDKEGESGG